MSEGLGKELMLEALACLDRKLSQPVSLVMGGGGAMILAHGFPLVTHDIDAIPKNMELSALDKQIKSVAKELNIPGDWLNPYFVTFTHTLPKDYGQRLIEVFHGKHLQVEALGKEEMLIMKCFAHRAKDVSHAKALIRGGANTDFVEKHIEKLVDQGIPLSQEAIDFLDELMDQT